jgi:hypothetical protein
MDTHVKEFFSESSGFRKGNFFRVIPLHDSVDIDWQTLSQEAPILPKGWYELSQLTAADRIQFTMEFWQLKLPYHPNLVDFLTHFFESLDDIGVFLTQKKKGDPMTPYMVYCLSEDRGFYRGAPPATDSDVLNLQKLFPDIILPEDYIAFLQIHDGFWKATDTTGITSSKNMQERQEEFQRLLEDQPPVVTKSGKAIDPNTLIPFYESFGMPYYQCFWSEWYPSGEMGNVYYSSAMNMISDVDERGAGPGENMSFPTFIDWLMFYLEQIE